jgi:hypothetical protein
MASGNPEDHDRAREGPIQEYLDRYGDRTDESARKMRRWADDMDLALRDRQLDKRFRMGLSPDDDAERAAFAAVRNEDEGDLQAAQERWTSLVKHSESTDRDQRVWGLLAKKRLHDLTTLAGRVQDLLGRLNQARRTEQPFDSKVPEERKAAEALHYEEFGDLVAAQERWQRQKKEYEKDAERRPWYLLASWKVRELKDHPPTEEQKDRPALVQKKLAQAQTLLTTNPAEAWVICYDLVTLYGNKDPELAKVAAQALDLLNQLRPANETVPTPQP